MVQAFALTVCYPAVL